MSATDTSSSQPPPAQTGRGRSRARPYHSSPAMAGASTHDCAMTASARTLSTWISSSYSYVVKTAERKRPRQSLTASRSSSPGAGTGGPCVSGARATALRRGGRVGKQLARVRMMSTALPTSALTHPHVPLKRNRNEASLHGLRHVREVYRKKTPAYALHVIVFICKYDSVTAHLTWAYGAGTRIA